MRFAYTVLLYLLVPWMPLYLLWRGRRQPLYRKRWSERFFGHVPARVPRGSIWVHAASVGEVQAAGPFLRELRHRYPGIPLVVTTQTPTGALQLDRQFGDSVHHCYVPFDLPHAVAAFLNRLQPRLAIIVEMELWPNLFHGIHRRRIPLLLVNARLSASTAAGYSRVRRLMEPVLQCPTRIAAQSRDDARRLLELGAPDERLVVAGSLKFDQSVPASTREQGEVLRQQLGANRPTWIAASTREGEEEQVLAAHALVLKTLPETLLILVPRHPDRFDGVADLVQEAGFNLARRSEGGVCPAHVQVYLGDTMGELPLLYAASDIAFVGGSLVPMGAHNLLEPAALGLPVLVGLHTYNFADITRQLVEAGACDQVADANLLADAVIELLENPDRRADMGRAGRGMVEANRGATGFVIDEVKALLESSR
ncbi:3-deoxy-D-manno-octulosonic-acid transferase [Natronocella acetinitrilica]|uniref:3-deoxy-D-manno-octulosonic acid transferase n=1 Tax=Natronocella acetinitrilica TaxID=414046 RepID=A0AAE3G2C9_9GAMM|nr:lipid IV(A) 3-deoxy-D-manno-octulosonic acid transferase [Natronocella acetinitrilica]MCP1673168.1 3-deoxy-D-manno-octulosonic-acid transferase [Natronocella acetinitrilica]